MSTQRREDRATPSDEGPLPGAPVSLAACNLHGSRGQFGKRIFPLPGAGFPCKRRWPNGPAGHSGTRPDPQKAQRQGCVAELPRMAATDSLQSDHRNQHRAWPVQLDIHLGWPPLKQAAARRPLRNIPSGVPLVPIPAVTARLHPALPWDPAALSCRTERYDGKRDLHFQHAA